MRDDFNTEIIHREIKLGYLGAEFTMIDIFDLCDELEEDKENEFFDYDAVLLNNFFLWK